MVDTTCLLIPLTNVVFLDQNNKEIPDWDLHSKTEYYSKYIRNPTKKDKESGLYFPRLTLYDRRFGDVPKVKIEFSAPKLLYCNNLQELTDNDFDEVIQALQDRLIRMGVRIFNVHLRNANVSSIHFSKNILLENGYTASYIISQITKINLRKSFDFTRSKYTNDGQSLCAHTSSHELVIYDKIADLKKLKKRAIDRDQTKYQMSLFNKIKKSQELIEILRFEIRLTRKQKLKSILKKVGFEKDITFQNLFSTSLSKLVVTLYWEDIVKSNNLGLFTIETGTKDTFQSIYHSVPEMKAKEAIYLLGLMTLAKEANGLRELRSIIETKGKQRSWYRIAKDFREISDSLSKNKLRDWVIQLDLYIKEYQLITKLPCKE
jgi:hypothetical protein